MNDHIEIIRNAAKAKSPKNMLCAAWRVNAEIEARSLDKAFTRNKLSTDDEKQAFAEKLALELREQERYRKQLHDAKTFVPQPRMLATWINQSGWMDEFEHQSSELKEKAQKLDKKCECGEDATLRYAEKVWLCEKHYREKQNDWRTQRMREWWLKHGNTNTDGVSMREHCYQLLPNDIRRMLDHMWGAK